VICLIEPCEKERIKRSYVYRIGTVGAGNIRMMWLQDEEMDALRKSEKDWYQDDAQDVSG